MRCRLRVKGASLLQAGWEPRTRAAPQLPICRRFLSRSRFAPIQCHDRVLIGDGLLLACVCGPRFRSDRTSAVCVVPPGPGVNLRRANESAGGNPKPEDSGSSPASPGCDGGTSTCALAACHHDVQHETSHHCCGRFLLRDCCIARVLRLRHYRGRQSEHSSPDAGDFETSEAIPELNRPI